MASTELTQKQRQVLDFLRRYYAENHYQPSREEIAKNFGWASVNSAQEVLMALQKKGAVLISPGRSRAIRILM